MGVGARVRVPVSALGQEEQEVRPRRGRCLHRLHGGARLPRQRIPRLNRQHFLPRTGARCPVLSRHLPVLPSPWFRLPRQPLPPPLPTQTSPIPPTPHLLLLRNPLPPLSPLCQAGATATLPARSSRPSSTSNRSTSSPARSPTGSGGSVLGLNGELSRCVGRLWVGVGEVVGGVGGG